MSAPAWFFATILILVLGTLAGIWMSQKFHVEQLRLEAPTGVAQRFVEMGDIAHSLAEKLKTQARALAELDSRVTALSLKIGLKL